MAFCRFSDDNFRCGFYAYESSAGFELHVAGSRISRDPPASPCDPGSLNLTSEEFSRISREYHRQLEQAERVPIELEGAGLSHRFGTLEELRDACAEHIERGFTAPGWLLPMLDREIQECVE